MITEQEINQYGSTDLDDTFHTFQQAISAKNHFCQVGGQFW